MSSYALPSGSYRAASLKQVWLGAAQAKLMFVWRGLEAFGRRRAAAQMAETARHLAVIRPELSAELRRAVVELDRQG